MPSSLLQGVLEAVLQPVVELGCHFVGRMVVPILSLGRWKCDRLTADTPRRKMRWGGLFHRRGPHVYLTAEAKALAGFVFIALLVGAGLWLFVWAD